MSLLEDYKEFESMLSDGLELQGHSGINGPTDTTVYTVQEFYDHDEIMCEGEWANYHTDCDVSIKNILTNEVCLHTYEFDSCLNSFTNGNFKQFLNQVEYSVNIDEFIDYLEDNVDTDTEVKILRCLVENAY